MLFAWAGTKGVSFGPTIWQGPTGVLNQHIFKVSPRRGVDLGWLYWALRHVTNRIEKRAHGFKATLLHVKKSDIERQPIAVPPLPEQAAVKNLLSTWEASISAAERLLANSRTQSLLLKKELLSGRKRLLPGSSWPRRKIADLIRESRIPGARGHVARKITVKLYGKGVVEKSEKRIGSESTQYYRRSAGQFVYSKLDFLNGAFGIIPQSLDAYESTLDLPAFDFIADVNSQWFLNFVAREEFYSSKLGLANGGRKARRVNPKDLLKIAIDVPPVDEQQAIARAIAVSEGTIQAEARSLELLRTEQSFLIEKLMRGECRIESLQLADVEPA